MGRPKGSKNLISTKIKKLCKTCGNEFMVVPSMARSIFCSYPCYWKDLEKRPGPNLGRKFSDEFKKKISNAQKGKRLGQKSSSWRGGRHHRLDGYTLVKVYDHPNSINNYIFEHRLVMEKHLGRLLKNDEVVHHINGNRSDNRLENLKLFKNSAEHNKFHYDQMNINKTNGRFLPSNLGC